MLKPDGEIVRETHDNDVAARLVVSPPIDPQVEDIMQVHVAQQDADRSALRCPLLVRMNLSIFQNTCFQPAPHQADQARICHSVLHKPEQPLVT